MATLQDEITRNTQDVLYINMTTCLCCVECRAPFNASSFHRHICPMKAKTNCMVNQWEHEILSSVRVFDKLYAHLFVMKHKETKNEIPFVVLPKFVKQQSYCYMLGCLSCRNVYSMTSFTRHSCASVKVESFMVERRSLDMNKAKSKLFGGVDKIYECEE